MTEAAAATVREGGGGGGWWSVAVAMAGASTCIDIAAGHRHCGVGVLSARGAR